MHNYIYIKCKANTAHKSVCIEHVRIVSVTSRPLSYWHAPTQTSMTTTEFRQLSNSKVWVLKHLPN